uniref:Uncharacterized protein n=1 Tax=Vibrio phage Vc1 TaxID=1480731 RepID=A0A6M5CDR0_9CAUD
MRKLLWIAMFALIVASVFIRGEHNWIDALSGWLALTSGYIAGRLDESRKE